MPLTGTSHLCNLLFVAGTLVLTILYELHRIWMFRDACIPPAFVVHGLYRFHFILALPTLFHESVVLCRLRI